MERLLDDEWAHDLRESDDVFALVEALDIQLDESLNDVASASVPCPEPAALPMVMQHAQAFPAGQQSQAPRPLAHRQTKDTERVERMRARNREAQARYRQKAKGQAVELKNSIDNVQAVLPRALERQQQLQDQRTQLKQRLSNSIAALDTILSVSSLIPPSTGQSGAPPAQHPAAAPMQEMQEAWPPAGTPCTDAATSLVLSHPSRHSRRSVLFGPDTTTTPRPLSEFRHHRPISIDLVDPTAFTELVDVRDDFEARTSQASCTPPSASKEIRLRHAVDAFRAAEAAKCGCEVSDIAWFVQTHVEVFEGSENEQTSKAEEFIHSLSSSGFAEGNKSSPACAPRQKRRRGACGSAAPPSAPRIKPLRSTAEMMESAGVTDAHIDACHVRCGIGDVAPLRAAVKGMFHRTVLRHSGLLPVAVLQWCFEQAIATIDRFLEGLKTGMPERDPMHAAPAGSVASDTPEQGLLQAPAGSSSGLPGSMWNGVVPNSVSSLDTDMTPPSGPDGMSCAASGPAVQEVQAATVPCASTDWHEHQNRQTDIHTLCAVLTARAELLALLDEMPSLIEKSSLSESPCARLKLQRPCFRLSLDFCFSEILATLDSAKLMFNLIVDAFKPFLGQYFQVENMHMQLYKAVRLTALQRARLAEYWMVQERQKRSLDGHMHEARALLAALPSHLPLPLDFFTHLNAILSTPSTCKQAAACSLTACPARLMQAPLLQQLSAVFTRSNSPSFSGTLQPCLQHPPSHMHTSGHSLIPHMSGTHGLHYPTAAGLESEQLHSHLAAEDGPAALLGVHLPEVRFLGQYPEDMCRAERAMGKLRKILVAETNCRVDLMNHTIPGVLLDVDKQHRVWADHFVSQLLPPDFMELCQIAATQQNRRRLFEDPFRCMGV